MNTACLFQSARYVNDTFSLLHNIHQVLFQGKGEEFLCSLSTFDAYVVSRIHKSPKPFVFAVKSTDPITLFENKSDYLHVFCCSEEGGRKWVENILLAKVSL